jgi:hypothetical protein
MLKFTNFIHQYEVYIKKYSPCIVCARPRESVAHDSAGDIVKMVSSEKVKVYKQCFLLK